MRVIENFLRKTVLLILHPYTGIRGKRGFKLADPSVNDQYWPNFLNQRKAALIPILNLTGVNINVPPAAVRSITDEIRSVPGLLTFFFNTFILDPHSPIPNRIREYMLGLSEYRGQTQFKLVKTFLEEDVTLAHLRWGDANEIGRFKAQLEEYDRAGTDTRILHLHIQNLYLLPITSPNLPH